MTKARKRTRRKKPAEKTDLNLGANSARESSSELAPNSPPSFPVVGVGASAGGLEAFTLLLKSLPDNPGMAFVLVPHLEPKHESAMTELLGRATRMPVLQVNDGMRLKPDHVYVIPPNRDMTIYDGMLRLEQREKQPGVHMPIDTFFRSLASELHSNAVGVILSGTASDGTLGVAAIKSEGGITFAQDSRSAKYDGMPNSAVASGCIDLVMPPDKIAQELTRIRHHPYVTERLDRIERPTGRMSRVFHLLKQVCRVDFSDYKPATIRRLVLRRMALRRIENLSEYVNLLQEDRNEVEALYGDILINVTSFFRDPGVFQALRETVYPAVLKERTPAETIRIWVPGCSTGEEAYSHAIALLEYLSDTRADASVQIFATDLSLPAVRRARIGIYKESIRTDVSAERLKRFFNKIDSGYQISKTVRDMCVFANQNVFSDPPFSHIDILSCRNVLIYLSQVLQKRVIPIFHYALRSRGFLMVGSTEGLVGTGAELFELVHRKHKIYRKRAVPSPVAFGVPPEHFDPTIITTEPLTAMTKPEPVRTPIELQREADRLLLTRYVPAAVVVSADLDILQTRGNASRYLELPSGKASLNILKMIKAGLLFELQNALDEVKKTGDPVRKENLQMEANGGFTTVSLEVIPFQAPAQSVTSFVIVFEPSETKGKKKVPTPRKRLEPQDAKDQLINQLKHELTATKEYQQSIIEALEASNEELQSANEEIQSGNEELQSTNEELQTSKEELESANEELNTVNEEMQHRNYQLGSVNSDLTNLLASVNLPIIMLSSDLTIRRFTPNAADLLGLTAADVGRPLVQVRLKLQVPDLETTMLHVMRDSTPRQKEFEHGKSWYRLRVTPYQTTDSQTEGVVAALFDITDFKNREKSRPSRETGARRKRR